MNVRETFGWKSPNEAAVLIAMLFPIAWGIGLAALRQREWPRARAAIFLASGLALLGLAAALALTASRSGAISAAGAGMAMATVALWCRSASLRAILVGILIPAGAFLLTLNSIDDSRFSVETMTTDRSAEIRLDLWKAGLRMVAEEPLSGWGVGQSGLHYMHWFQEPSDPKRVAGMIQSYLHIGVERGLLYLGGFVVLILWVPVGGLLLARKAATEKRNTLTVVGCTVLGIGTAWALGNAFSTLWIIGDLWWLPAGAAGLCAAGFLCVGKTFRLLLNSLALSTAGAGLICVAIWIAGHLVHHDPTVSTDGVHLYLDAPNLDRPAKEPPARWAVYPDPAVLGTEYGRHLRQWMEVADIEAARIPKNPGQFRSDSGNGSILVMGKWAGRAMESDSADLICILHPTVPPGEVRPSDKTRVIIVLPGLDETGHEAAWKNLAKQHGWRIISSGWTGTDIRSKWIELLPLLRVKEQESQ